MVVFVAEKRYFCVVIPPKRMKSQHPRISKRQFRILLALFVLDIALATYIFTAHDSKHKHSSFFDSSDDPFAELPDTMLAQREACDAVLWSNFESAHSLQTKAQRTNPRLYRVESYATEFNDSNFLQVATAQMFGIPPMSNRQDFPIQDAKQMVFVGTNPFYHVDSLNSSAPYLTPSAQIMLTRIGRNFTDSLFAKRIRPALPIVTSVTRSLEDVARLQRRNRNATTNSCHTYGTTIDISYTRFYPIVRAPGDTIRLAHNDTLKTVLGEVLRDLRQQGVCFVKHEKRQSCFHITVR